MQKVIKLTAFLTTILFLPCFIKNEYYFNVLIFIGIHTILVLGLNLLMGYAGQISLGHAAFFGLGAYISGILTAKFNFPVWPAILLALIGTMTVAYVVALPCLKLRGHYLAMATLGFGIIMYILFRELAWLTGGTSGLVGIKPLSFGNFVLCSVKSYYYFVWITLFAIFVFSLNLVESRIGWALRALHDSEKAAQAVGIPTQRLKVIIFVLSAGYAALAGCLYAHFITFISPSSFDFIFSIKLVTMVVIGGMASIWGSLLGATVLTILPEVLTVFQDYDIVVYGLILIVVMIFLPQGLTRGILDCLEKVRYERTIGVERNK